MVFWWSSSCPEGVCFAEKLILLPNRFRYPLGQIYKTSSLSYTIYLKKAIFYLLFFSLFLDTHPKVCHAWHTLWRFHTIHPATTVTKSHTPERFRNVAANRARFGLIHIVVVRSPSTICMILYKTYFVKCFFTVTKYLRSLIFFVTFAYY